MAPKHLLSANKMQVLIAEDNLGNFSNLEFLSEDDEQNVIDIPEDMIKIKGGYKRIISEEDIQFKSEDDKKQEQTKMNSKKKLIKFAQPASPKILKLQPQFL